MSMGLIISMLVLASEDIYLQNRKRINRFWLFKPGSDWLHIVEISSMISISLLRIY